MRIFTSSLVLQMNLMQEKESARGSNQKKTVDLEDEFLMKSY
jgi:hypothetical protein